MRQVKLKSVLSKLCMLGIYLLFLSVQLHLKYTFSTASSPGFSHSISNNTTQVENAGKIMAAQEGKPAVQKLRLNKRYVHEQAYQVSTAFEEVVIIFSETPDQIANNGQEFLTLSLLPSFLRGPPLSTISTI